MEIGGGRPRIMMRFKSTFAKIAIAAIGVAATAATAAPPSASDVGGAKAGMVYAEARKRILAAGYRPVPRPTGEFCGYSEPCQLPETEACAGTGDGQCSYVFAKGARRIQVDGVGGEEGGPQSQTVIRIEIVQ
jgi:hypothetical protein